MTPSFQIYNKIYKVRFLVLQFYGKFLRMQNIYLFFYQQK